MLRGRRKATGARALGHGCTWAGASVEVQELVAPFEGFPLRRVIHRRQRVRPGEVTLGARRGHWCAPADGLQILEEGAGRLPDWVEHGAVVLAHRRIP